MNFFITGTTGFLGSHLLKTIISHDKRNHAYILIRAKNGASSIERGRLLIDKLFTKSLQGNVLNRIHVVKGDVSKNNLGLGKKELLKLQDRIDKMYHLAALRNMGLGLDDLRGVNIDGTDNVLKTALSWKKTGSLDRVNHISTAYVAGNHKGVFYETELDLSQKPNNSYEKSKFEAEKIVLKYRKKGLPVDVYRPSIVLEKVPINKSNISIVLKFLKICASGFLKEIPSNKTATFNLVQAEAASKAIYLISTTKNLPFNQNYHIVNSKPVKVDTLLDIASLAIGSKKPKFISREEFRKTTLNKKKKRLVEVFTPYLNQSPVFDACNAASILDKYNFKIPRTTKSFLYQTIKGYYLQGFISKNNC